MRTNRSTSQGGWRGRATAAALVVGLLAACGSNGGDDDARRTDDPPAPDVEPQMGGTLVYALDAESDGYNPVSKRFAQAGHTVASAVFDTLTTWDAEGQEVVPYLAESMEPNDDFTEWTFTLRDGVEFHDGDPLNAEAVRDVMLAHKDSLITASSWADVEDVEAVDDLVVRVKLADPWPGFPALLTTQAGYIFDPDMLTDPDSGARPVGTGPFKFESWELNEKLVVVRNPDYWRTDEFGNQLPYLDQIEFRILPDAAERNAQLLRGDVDLLYSLTPSAIIDLRDARDLVVREYAGGDEDLIAFQTDDIERPTGPNGETRVSPFHNRDARLAVAYATDQEEFRAEVQQDVYPEAWGLWAPGQLGYREESNFPRYDPDKAREHVEAYKEATGADALAFTYYAADDVDNLRAAQFLADMWAEVGIEATVKAMPQVDIITNAVIGNFEALDWRNWGQPDPDVDHVWFHSDSVRPLSEGISVNISHFADAEVDEALDTGRQSTDEEERDEAYARVTDRFDAEVPYLWLGRVGWAMAARPDIHGWEIATENGTVATIGVKTWLADVWIS